MSPIADYNLGTARGKISIDFDGRGVDQGEKGLGRLRDKAGSTRGAFDTAAKGMGVAGLAIGAGIGLAVKSAADFESQLSDLKAVSGATGDQMDLVSKKALQLGKDTKFSAGDAALAMTELVKAGISVPDVLNGAADAAVNLAAAGGVDLPQAAELAANAMNQFSLTAQELPRVADLIAGAANASAIDVHDFGESLKQVGAAAHLAGIGFNDTAVAIALMGKAGIKGSDAGTSLKTFLLNLNPTTKKQTELMKDLGIITEKGGNQFFDAAGKAKPLAQISQVLQTALKDQTQQQKLATLQILFGSDAIRAAAILTQSGAKGFNDMSKAMGKVKAADVAKTKMDNLKGSIEQLKGSMETAGIAVGTVMLPILRKLTDGVTKAVNAFLNLPKGAQQTILILATIAAGFLLVAAGIIKVVFFAQRFIEAMRLISLAMSSTFLTNPVFLVVAAIVALIAIIVILAIKCEAFRNFFIGIWQSIVDFFKNFGPPIINAIKKTAEAIFNIWLTIMKVITFPTRVALALVIALFWSFFKTMAGLARGFWNMFGAPITAVFRALLKTLQIAAKGWQMIWAIIGPTVKSALSSVAGWIAWGAGKVWSGLQKLVSGIFRIFSGAGKWLVNAGRNIVIGLWNGIAALSRWIFNQIMNWVRRVVPGPVLRILGIGSPSKVFRGIGEDVGKGLEIGIVDSKKMVARAAADLASAAIPGVPTTAQATQAASASEASSAAFRGPTPALDERALADALVDALERRSISMATITDHVNKSSGRAAAQRRRTG